LPPSYLSDNCIADIILLNKELANKSGTIYYPLKKINVLPVSCNEMINEKRKEKWPRYDIERSEKTLAIVWALIIIVLLVYAAVPK
jgi:hypothetical protein